MKAKNSDPFNIKTAETQTNIRIKFKTAYIEFFAVNIKNAKPIANTRKQVVNI